MLDHRVKTKIDNLSLLELFRQHRFGALGDTCFQGDEGNYRLERLAELRTLYPDEYVSTSKFLGWSKK